MRQREVRKTVVTVDLGIEVNEQLTQLVGALTRRGTIKRGAAVSQAVRLAIRQLFLETCNEQEQRIVALATKAALDQQRGLFREEQIS